VLLAAVPAAASTTPGICLPATGSGGWCGDGLPAVRAKLSFPRDVAPLRGGGYLVADSANHVIRRVDRRGVITTIAGTGIAGVADYGKPAGANTLGTPTGVAPIPGGGYLIADATLAEVLRVTPAGRLLAGTGAHPGSTLGDGGPAGEAQLQSPRDVVILPGGGYAIADAGDHRVRRVLPSGTIRTLAGTGRPGFAGDGGPATAARLSQPTALAVAGDGALLVADRGNARIRRIAADGTISTVAGGGGGLTPALQARLTLPTGVAATADGGFLVAEPASIRRVGADGEIAVVGGTGEAGFNATTTPATAVALANPTAIAALADGRALVADTRNDRVRLLDPGRSTLTTVAGRAVPGPPGTPEPAPGVTLEPPQAPNLRAPIFTLPPSGDSAGGQPGPSRQPPSPGAPAPTPGAASGGGSGGAAEGPTLTRGRRPGGGGAPIVAASRTSCPGRNDRDPARFSDLFILPFSSRGLRSGPRIAVTFTINRRASVVARVSRSGRPVRSARATVTPGSLRRLALRGRVTPGTYRILIQATSLPDRLRRCDALTLTVRR
jgi:hypothetical protein